MPCCAPAEPRGSPPWVGAAREPEIVDLERFLNKLGARVSGAGTPVVTIEGGRPLHGAEHTVMGDRIVAATWLCACGAAGGEIALTGVEPGSLDTVLSCLEQAGGRLECAGEEIRFWSTGPLRGIAPVHTAPYPGFPTDAQAILMAALAGGRGQTLFVENMFESRYRHVPQLQRMGGGYPGPGPQCRGDRLSPPWTAGGEHRPAGRGRAGGGRPGGGGDHSGDPAEPHPPGLSGYGGNSSAAGSGHPPAPYKQKYRRRPWHL